jgi:hypothetical protein
MHLDMDTDIDNVVYSLDQPFSFCLWETEVSTLGSILPILVKQLLSLGEIQGVGFSL